MFALLIQPPVSAHLAVGVSDKFIGGRELRMLAWLLHIISSMLRDSLVQIHPNLKRQYILVMSRLQSLPPSNNVRLLLNLTDDVNGSRTELDALSSPLLQ
ncbi:hypothetical protein CLCR_10988 [Cladophialophora carrionii]|uniref:Uncharacterized protein n=1 Tax=Cladophialophora carrionii TaxID=86049 RepID=A0A1C1CZF3_9EURO|nr:hypothetical protein CLCR_10988 [Cladophialophora carrionii]